MNQRAWSRLVSLPPVTEKNPRGDRSKNASVYKAFGLDGCTGDHKPVLLLFEMADHL
jgi:hypothetical protein